MGTLGRSIGTRGRSLGTRAGAGQGAQGQAAAQRPRLEHGAELVDVHVDLAAPAPHAPQQPPQNVPELGRAPEVGVGAQVARAQEGQHLGVLLRQRRAHGQELLEEPLVLLPEGPAPPAPSPVRGGRGHAGRWGRGGAGGGAWGRGGAWRGGGGASLLLIVIQDNDWLRGRGHGGERGVVSGGAGPARLRRRRRHRAAAAAHCAGPEVPPRAGPAERAPP